MSKPFACGDEKPIYVPSGGCDCNYTLVQVESLEYAGVYQLMLNGEAVGDTVEIPLDKYIQYGEVRTVVADDSPYEGAVVGDKYFYITLANSNDPVYIPLGALDLANYYTKDEVDALIAPLDVCGSHPVGSVVITSTNDTPGSYLCGEWELIDKHFAPFQGSGESFTSTDWNSSMTKATRSVSVVRLDHSIYLRVIFTAAQAFGHNTYRILSISHDDIGADIASQHWVTGMSVGGNAAAFFSSTNTDPLKIQYLGNSLSGSIAADETMEVEFDVYCQPNIMHDDVCDKFYWKRIS